VGRRARKTRSLDPLWEKRRNDTLNGMSGGQDRGLQALVKYDNRWETGELRSTAPSAGLIDRRRQEEWTLPGVVLGVLRGTTLVKGEDWRGQVHARYEDGNAADVTTQRGHDEGGTG